MKLLNLFISIGVCSSLMMESIHAQQTKSTDDIIWKANLSYCLSKEKIDLRDLQFGMEQERCDVYNLKIVEQKGTFRKLLKLLYDWILHTT